MSRDLKSLLIYEAKRRPLVAELIERAGSLTDEEINTAAVPLSWYRKALRLLRDEQRKEVSLNFLRYIHEEPAVPAPMGEMRQWTHEATFIKTDTWLFELPPGFLIWLPEPGGVWIGSVFSKLVDERVKTHTEARGRMTHNEYRAAFKEQAINTCPIDAPVIDLTGRATPQRLASHGVRIG